MLAESPSSGCAVRSLVQFLLDALLDPHNAGDESRPRAEALEHPGAGRGGWRYLTVPVDAGEDFGRLVAMCSIRSRADS